MITAKQRRRIFRRDDFTCCYCRFRKDAIDLHVDHRIPKALGGSDEDSNLVTACYGCNTATGPRLIDENDHPAIATQGKALNFDRLFRQVERVRDQERNRAVEQLLEELEQAQVEARLKDPVRAFSDRGDSKV